MEFGRNLKHVNLNYKSLTTIWRVVCGTTPKWHQNFLIIACFPGRRRFLLLVWIWVLWSRCRWVLWVLGSRRSRRVRFLTYLICHNRFWETARWNKMYTALRRFRSYCRTRLIWSSRVLMPTYLSKRMELSSLSCKHSERKLSS